MKARDVAVYLALGVILLSMVASFTMVAAGQEGTTTSTPTGTSTPTSTPTDTPTGTTTTAESSEYTVDQIVAWAQDGRDISAQRAVEVQQFFLENQGKFSKQDIRLVSSWLQDELPEETATESPDSDAQNGSSVEEDLPQGVEEVLQEDKPTKIRDSVPGSDTVITEVEWRPDSDAVLVTVHTEVGREVVTANDIQSFQAPSGGGSFVPTQRRYVLDNDMGGQTFQIRVPAEAGRKGNQAICLTFRSADSPICYASESPKIWNRPATHWMAGFGVLLGASIFGAAIIYGGSPYKPYEREF